MVGVIAATLWVAGAHAQSPSAADSGTAPQAADTRSADGGRRGAYAGMARVMGEVTAVSGGTLTLKAEDGGTVQVVTTDNTRVMKDRGPVKVSDLHVGDGLLAMGNLDAPNKTLHAAVVMAEDAAQIKAMKENLGKTYITGRVKTIDLDNARMTVERADHVAQTIGFDESTSFKRAVRGGGGSGGPGGSGNGGEAGGSGREGGRGPGGTGMGGMALGSGIDRAFNNGESITLADIKVGDYLAGTGAVKNGTFVPTRVVDSPPGPHRQRPGGAPAEGTPSAPGTSPANPGPGAR